MMFTFEANKMVDNIKLMQALFKKKKVELSKNDGDNNLNKEYLEFIDLDQVESWSIALVSMTNNVKFISKFFNTSEALPIFADEYTKNVMHYEDNLLHIHCKTIDQDPYSFRIAIDNLSSFSTLYFLRSLKDLVYEPLVRDIESIIDWKLW